MKKIAIVFTSLFLFFACSDKAATEENSNETIENVNLEEDLGELETELTEIEKDTLDND